MAVSENNCAQMNLLSEDCIANVLLLTSPKDACRLSAVSPTFRSAAQTDLVWERFLPSDYHEIVSNAVAGFDSLIEKFKSKKELYLYLCDNPILIDGGRKSFSLEKSSGKKSYILSARELQISWGEEPRYWEWISMNESRFPEVVELKSVCWFEITGTVNTSMLSSGTSYTVYIVFSLRTSRAGFDYPPCEASVGISGDEERTQHTSVCLDLRKRSRRGVGRWIDECPDDYVPEEPKGYKKRDDGWTEIELGEIFINGGEDDDLEFSLKEVKGGWWKNGIVVEGIELRPKGN